MVNALINNLSPILSGKVPENFFEGKMETFLTCRALATYLKENILGNERGKIVEQLSLRAINATIFTSLPSADAELLLNELPNILPLKYLEVINIYENCLEVAAQIKIAIQSHIDCPEKFLYWSEFNNLDNLLRNLKGFESYINNKS